MARNKTYSKGGGGGGGGDYIIGNIDVNVEKFNLNESLFLK